MGNWKSGAERGPSKEMELELLHGLLKEGE